MRFAPCFIYLPDKRIRALLRGQGFGYAVEHLKLLRQRGQRFLAARLVDVPDRKRFVFARSVSLKLDLIGIRLVLAGIPIVVFALRFGTQ